MQSSDKRFGMNNSVRCY